MWKVAILLTSMAIHAGQKGMSENRSSAVRGASLHMDEVIPEAMVLSESIQLLPLDVSQAMTVVWKE